MITIVIPISKQDYKYSISAPLQWLIPQIDNIIGTFSTDKNIEYIIKNSKVLVIELNWFTEFFEVIEIIKFTKKINKNCKIIIGGLFSGYHYEKLILDYNIDFFIKGDNEFILSEFIFNLYNNNNINNTPNLVSKTFENDISYIFSKNEYEKLNFSINWIPQYKQMILNNHLQSFDEQTFASPMFINSKSGCSCNNKTNFCVQTCHGGNSIYKYYNRTPIKLTSKEFELFKNNFQDFNLYNHMSIIDMNDNFDWENISYTNKSVTIEMDSKITLNKLKMISKKFKDVHSIICGSGNSMLESTMSRESEIKEIIEFSENTKNIHSIDFYHHHNKEENETQLEKEYPEYFRHSNYWTSDNKYFNINNLFQFISDKKNIYNIYELSKRITLNDDYK